MWGSPRSPHMPWQEASIVSKRMELVALASVEGANVAELCRRFGVSRPTAYKWIERAESGSVVAFDDRSRRPHSSPERTGAAMEERVVAVRRSHPAWGGRKIRAVLLGRGTEGVPSASTVTAILRRHGLID